MQYFSTNKLTRKEEEFCTITGVIGLALSLVCLLQHLYAMYSNWLTWLMAAVYVLAVIAFSLLIKKHWLSPHALMVVSVLLLLDAVFLFLTLAFSPVVIITLLYSMVMAIYLFIERFPQKFKTRKKEVEQEENYWKDKL